MPATARHQQAALGYSARRSRLPRGQGLTAFTRWKEMRAALGAVVEWAADRDSAGSRRGVQIALGLLWLLDAALQYQPFMFGKGLVTGVLVPAQSGNPAAVASPPLGLDHVIAASVPPWNAAFATIQLALAVGLLWRRTTRAALAASVAWALRVWWLGEGLGQVLAGTATPVTGAPCSSCSPPPTGHGPGASEPNGCGCVNYSGGLARDGRGYRQPGQRGVAVRARGPDPGDKRHDGHVALHVLVMPQLRRKVPVAPGADRRREPGQPEGWADGSGRHQEPGRSLARKFW